MDNLIKGMKATKRTLDTMIVGMFVFAIILLCCFCFAVLLLSHSWVVYVSLSISILVTTFFVLLVYSALVDDNIAVDRFIEEVKKREKGKKKQQ